MIAADPKPCKTPDDDTLFDCLMAGWRIGERLVPALARKGTRAAAVIDDETAHRAFMAGLRAGSIKAAWRLRRARP